MYDGDSFYTLTQIGRIGLALLSVFLAAVSLFAAGRLFRLAPKKSLPVVLAARLGAAIFILWAFVWLSPQVYYLYYQMIFEGLPWQIVIRNPPEFHSVLAQISFSGPATLSAHGKGVLGWLLILYAALWPVFLRSRQTKTAGSRSS